MSVDPRRLTTPSPIDEAFDRVRGIERQWSGPWRYVGDAGEPPFVNGSNAGGDAQELRFRWILYGKLEIQGSVTGVTAGQTIFVLPDEPAFRFDDARDGDIYLPASDDAGGFVAFKIVKATREVVFLG